MRPTCKGAWGAEGSADPTRETFPVRPRSAPGGLTSKEIGVKITSWPPNWLRPTSNAKPYLLTFHLLCITNVCQTNCAHPHAEPWGPGLVRAIAPVVNSPELITPINSPPEGPTLVLAAAHVCAMKVESVCVCAPKAHKQASAPGIERTPYHQKACASASAQLVP